MATILIAVEKVIHILHFCSLSDRKRLKEAEEAMLVKSQVISRWRLAT